MQVYRTLGAVWAVGSIVSSIGCGSTVSEPLPLADTTEYRACSVDSDCVYAQNGCCDCANGGEDIAVAKDSLQDFRDQFDCEGVACTERGADPPCGSGEVSCIDGTCSYALAD